MKIASDIASSILMVEIAERGWDRDSSLDQHEVESIIAAKLEPVKEALKALYRACDVNDHTVIAIELAESVLAMFDEANDARTT